MTILSDGGILKAMENGDLAIEDFIEKNLTPNGYDLTISEIKVGQEGELQTSGDVIIPPGQWFAVSTKEYIKCGPEITTQLWIRTSWARRYGLRNRTPGPGRWPPERCSWRGAADSQPSRCRSWPAPGHP